MKNTQQLHLQNPPLDMVQEAILEHPFVIKAKKYAISCHSNTNHLYDGMPYENHLKMVVLEAVKYIEIIDPVIRPYFIAAAWCHDIIEDTRQTYNDVAQQTHTLVADLVYAVTNEKGKSRLERANDKYYSDMLNVPAACLLKVCDRIANLNYSILNNSKMAEKYTQENPAFMKKFENVDCCKGALNALKKIAFHYVNQPSNVPECNKQQTINHYIKQKHSQDECAGFIDGYEACAENFKSVINTLLKWVTDSLAQAAIVEKIKSITDDENYFLKYDEKHLTTKD